ncbi:AraC family transcriptional regulator [Priestia megaterium]|nr:AraC family transcriptional regulator [Priestia megaterium]
MAWVESIQKSINYIEDHLLEEITIESVAKQANASAFYFQRAFTMLTGIAVGEYIRRRRLTLAAQELSRINCKIIDLAYKYGYDTPEAFSKAFRRQHGISPSEARKYVGKLKLYERLIIQVTLKGAEPMKYNVVEREHFQVVGIKREFSMADMETSEGIPKFWDEANSNGTSEWLERSSNGTIKGLLGVCAPASNPQSKQAIDYWIAAEYDGALPNEMKALEIPAAKWVVFNVHGPMPDAMQKAWKQIFSEWFPTSGYEHADAPELEVYSEGDPYGSDYYSEIWIPVK